MSLDYTNVEIIKQRLLNAHNPEIAKIRGNFFEKESAFFREHITNKTVLVAGSGLGHDAFVLAENNKDVLGIDMVPKFLEYASDKAYELGLKNVMFFEQDMLKLDPAYNGPLGEFDVAVLNMGTISDFEGEGNVINILFWLLNYSKEVYFDFYPPTKTGLEIRKKMYEEEGWKNVKIENNVVVSDDGLFSKSLSKDEIKKIAGVLMADIEFHTLCEFAEIAVIRKKPL